MAIAILATALLRLPRFRLAGSGLPDGRRSWPADRRARRRALCAGGSWAPETVIADCGVAAWRELLSGSLGAASVALHENSYDQLTTS